MTDGQDLINDEVVSLAKRIEDEYETIDDLEPLDVEWLVGSSGHVKEITLTLATGGPHLEVKLNSGTVRGYWAGDEHSVPIFENEELLERAFDYYEQQFECIR